MQFSTVACVHSCNSIAHARHAEFVFIYLLFFSFHFGASPFRDGQVASPEAPTRLSVGTAVCSGVKRACQLGCARSAVLEPRASCMPLSTRSHRMRCGVAICRHCILTALNAMGAGCNRSCASRVTAMTTVAMTAMTAMTLMTLMTMMFRGGGTRRPSAKAPPPSVGPPPPSKQASLPNVRSASQPEPLTFLPQIDCRFHILVLTQLIAILVFSGRRRHRSRRHR
jgi:hypothetical protein